jgi:4-hydroxy-3-methylbut-2-enyl diphosphate reductase
MQIIRAQKMGFCAGVRRAVMTAEKALDENKDGQVYTFGPLIHNPEALKKFEDRSLKVLSEKDIPVLKKNDTVVIRAHGVPPETKDKLEKTGVKLLDGTCPIVQVNQKKCSDFASEGYAIFFTGDANHGEVTGIEGSAGKGALSAGKTLNFFLINSPEQALDVLEKNAHKTDFSKTVLISQTTFSVKVFDLIADALKEKLPQIKVCRTICPATWERQESLDKLCSEVEGVIVIGGRNSANTNRLYDKASLLCKHAVLIENAGEIPEEFFKLSRVGLTAGASTPDDVIDEVENCLSGAIAH